MELSLSPTSVSLSIDRPGLYFLMVLNTPIAASTRFVSPNQSEEKSITSEVVSRVLLLIPDKVSSY
jgi:hypothetical protein